ncbi:MAG: hypothetical protein IKU29_02850 [Parabacteroides sp.]|nr:hypothetical protein [Parabacteroides sp.]
MNIRVVFISCMMIWLGIFNVIPSLAQLPLVRTQLTISTFQEFCNLFNGNSRELPLLEKFPRLINVDRIEFLKGLFDLTQERNKEEIIRFVSYIEQNNLYITLNNTIALADFIYTDNNNNDISIYATLKEIDSPTGKQWILKQVQSTAFYLGDISKNGIIGVTDNEVYFPAFEHNIGANPYHIAGEDFKQDNISVFLFMTANKLIRFKHTKQLCYQISLGEYLVTISRIVDEQLPVAGWVITSLQKDGQIVFGKITPNQRQ